MTNDEVTTLIKEHEAREEEAKKAEERKKTGASS